MNRRVFALLAMLTATWSPASHAIVVTIDQFVIQQNGAVVWSDDFSNNLTPSQEAAYGVNGAFPVGAESGGLLTLNSDFGILTANAAEQARRSLTVTRLTPNSLANSNSLTINDSVAVTGKFSLVAPSGPLTNGYGVRVIESGQANVERLVELDVQYNATFGGQVIRYLLQDFVANSITTLGFVALSPPASADEVELEISRDAVNHSFFGSYAFGTGGTFGPLTQFSTPGELFTSTDFVRGQFIAFTAIPEPATLALLGLGIAGLGFSRRRQA